MNLAAAFAETAHQHAHKTALFWGESQYTCADLWRQSRLVSHHLQQHYGVRPGDRVDVVIGSFHADGLTVE